MSLTGTDWIQFPGVRARNMTGTPNQVEWALPIRRCVEAEFDRVAKALAAVADAQPAESRSDTESLLLILAEKRATVLAHEQAGYFIREWREVDGRVQRLILQDERYLAIRRRIMVRQTASSRSLATAQKESRDPQH